ncbi:desert hedgehog protein [Takifugu rubripes]|uniref:Hedgehog protein n=1 Tax=Takifugu rubripes TaxID=31033 RepID=A0A3B5K1N7_TAKRU|nr:desert hedgehog protein [Takifugu rubripes]
MKQCWWARLAQVSLLAAWSCVWLVQGCGPGPGYGIRTRPRKLKAMYYKQFFPNLSENNLGASGRAEGKITRNSERFNELVCNYNPDIVFKDEENTNADRFMTKRCKDCLNRLALAVMNQWPGVHLRVTEAWDEDGHHPPGSLHYEGRAVDITTDDRETEKYGLLAQLAVEAGFDWVHYESKYHIHCSVKADHSVAVEKGGCFPGWSRVTVAGGFQKSLSSLTPGDRVMALSETGQVVFSPVLLFLHRDPESRWRFLSLQTEDGRRLAVTPHHLVFSDAHCGPDSSQYQAQFASRAQTGTCVLVHTAGGEVHPSRIVSITEEESVGAYAPLTEAGSVFVDGVLASSYALVEDHRLAHWAFGPVRLLSSVSQLLWAEPEERSDGSKTPLQPHALVRGDRKVCARNRTSVRSEAGPRGRTSEVHWYAQLLHRLGWIVLNPDLFHP